MDQYRLCASTAKSKLITYLSYTDSALYFSSVRCHKWVFEFCNYCILQLLLRRLLLATHTTMHHTLREVSITSLNIIPCNSFYL